MILSDNPKLALLQLQNHANITADEVVSNSEKSKKAIAVFKELKEVALVINESLKIKVYFPNNTAPQTITGIKILAAPWTNGHEDESIDCKIKLKLSLKFAGVSISNNWESSLYSLELLNDSLTIVNHQNRERDLRFKNQQDFEDISATIKEWIVKIGMEYPVEEKEEEK